MTGSSVSRPRNDRRGPLRDEAALESLFRAHFSALCAEAKSHLGAEAAALRPKVVEQAFRQAWDDREQHCIGGGPRDVPARRRSPRIRARAESPGRCETSEPRCEGGVAARRDRGGRRRHDVAPPVATAPPGGRPRRRAGLLGTIAASRGGARRRLVQGAIVEGPGAHRHRGGGPRRRRDVVPHVARRRSRGDARARLE